MFSTGFRARTNHLRLSHTQVSQAIRVDGFGPGAPCSLAQHPEARDAPWGTFPAAGLQPWGWRRWGAVQGTECLLGHKSVERTWMGTLQ